MCLCIHQVISVWVLLTIVMPELSHAPFVQTCVFVSPEQTFSSQGVEMGQVCGNPQGTVLAQLIGGYAVTENNS